MKSGQSQDKSIHLPWSYTLGTKQNVVLFFSMFLPVLFALLATSFVFFLIGWVNWWQMLLAASLYIIPLGVLFAVTAVRLPTVYTVRRDFIIVQKGWETRSLDYRNIRSVSLKQGRKSASILFRLKKGFSIHCQMKYMTDFTQAKMVYRYIQNRLEESTMTNAESLPVSILNGSDDPIYKESVRKFQGCPTIAVSKGGRIFAGWYAGGVREPDMENYNLLIYSDDKGKSWSSPLLLIPSSKELKIHALDIQLWVAPSGTLYVFWVQNNTLIDQEQAMQKNKGQPLVRVDGWIYPDFTHNEWYVTCDDPDAENPVFSFPRRMDCGFLRCKPTVLDSGRILLFNYDQTEGKGLLRYGYSISDDGLKTVRHRYGATKLDTLFDEAMAYQRKDGSLRMLARSSLGCLVESVSKDNGETWSDASASDIVSADSRFFVSRTPSGKILLIVNHDAQKRKNLTLLLSDDDGKTWRYQKCIDTREDISYPDADFLGGEIVLVYDRERTGAKEINFAIFTEEDIINPNTAIEIHCISKPIGEGA